jgi:lipoprotein-releasing system permease protein
VDYQNRITTPILRGVDPEAEEKVIPIKKYIISGDGTLQGDSVLVGKEWAARSGVFIGDKVRIYAPRQMESLRDAGKPNHAVVLPTELVVTGIFQTGLFDYDLNFFITSLENAQYLYNLQGGVHGIAVRVADPAKVGELKRALNAECVLPLQARTWMDQNRPLFTAIATERVAMTFILFFIMIVAAFGLCSTLITITVQKTREIGVLKALGATDGQVRGIFLLHGLIVGTLGACLGVGLAGVVLAYRNDFRLFVANHFGINVFSPDVYQFIQIPAEISPWSVIIIAFSGVGVCMLAALIPAQGAARLLPSQALRYD